MASWRAASVLLLLLLAPGARGAAASPADDAAAAEKSIAAGRDLAAERSISAGLTAHGFENVAVRSTNGRVTVWYENRVYRYEMRAIGLAARIASAHADSAAFIEIVPENRGVAILSLAASGGDWSRFLDGRADAAWFRSRLEIRGDGALASSRAERADVPETNASRWRTDVAMRPLVDLLFGVPGDPARVSAWVAPEATMSPARGALITAQAVVRVHDEIPPDARFIAPGRNTLSAACWLPGAWLAAGSAGIFSDDRYGFAAEAGRLFMNGALEGRVGGDLSGELEFGRTLTTYSSIGAWSAFAAITHRTPLIDLETTLTAGRFLYGDKGVRLDVSRRFHETEFGFFGIDTQIVHAANGQVTAGGRVVGFRMSIPLPVEKLGRPAPVRAVTVPAFPWEYRESTVHAAVRVKLYDNLARFRKGLYPTFVSNNLDDLRGDPAARSAEGAR